MSNLIIEANITGNIDQKIKNIDSELTNIARKAANSGSMMDKAFSNVGNTLDRMGLNMSNFIGPAGALAAAFKFQQLAKDAYEFERAFGMAMREVSTISDAAKNNFEAMSESIIDMAANGPDSAIKLAKAYYQIASAGHDGAEGLKLLEISSKAAVAGVTDTITAANGLTTVINAWQLSSEKANSVADVMFQSVKRGKTTFAELAQSIAQVAPLAAANNIEFEQIFAALQTLTKQGVPTAQAMTQIRSSLVNMTKVLGDGWGNVMTYQEGLGKIGEMAKGSQNKLRELIPDVEGIGAVLALTGKNAKGAAEDLSETAKAAGSMEEAYGRMMEEADNKWSIVHNKWTREVRELGKAMKEESGNLADFMDALLSSGADVKPDMSIYGIADKIKALRMMGGSLIGSYVKGGLMPEQMVRDQYAKFVKTIQDYASNGLAQQKIKLSDILGIESKDERLTKLQEFLKQMKDAETDLGNVTFQNDQQQKAALKIRADLWGEVAAKAEEAIKAIETEKPGAGDAKARTLKTMLDDIKTAQDSLGTGSLEKDIATLSKISALQQEVVAYYAKIREARKIETITAIKPQSGKDSLGGVQTITKEQTKQEFQGEKLLRQSKARTAEALKQADAIKDQNDKYIKQTAFFESLTGKLGDASELLGAMSYAIGEFDSTLGASVGKMADIANNAKNMVDSFAAGNNVGAIASGIGIIGNVIGIFSSFKNDDSTTKALERTNQLLSQQAAILANMPHAQAYFEIAAKQYADYGTAIDLTNQKLQDSYIITKEEQAKLLALPTKPAEYTGSDPYEKARYKKELDAYNNARTEINKVNAEIATAMNDRKNWSPEQFIEAYANGSLILDKQQIDWITEITEKQKQRAELLQETFRTALGFDSSDVSDSIFQGIEDGLKLGENSLGGFAQSFGDLMKKALMQAITESVNTDITTNFLPKVKEFLQNDEVGQNGEKLTTRELSILEKLYSDDVKKGQELTDALKPLTDKYGTSSSPSSSTPLTGISASMTEETGSLVAGQFMAMRNDLKTIQETGISHLHYLDLSLSVMREIASNTKPIYRLEAIENSVAETTRILRERL